MVSEGCCDCSDETVLMSPNQETFSFRMGTYSPLVNELILAPCPRCIRVAICNLLLSILELVH